MRSKYLPADVPEQSGVVEGVLSGRFGDMRHSLTLTEVGQQYSSLLRSVFMFCCVKQDVYCSLDSQTFFSVE